MMKHKKPEYGRYHESRPDFQSDSPASTSIWTLEWKVEMGPDLIRAYFWPIVNKRPTRLRPRYFLTRPQEIFFDPKVKIEKFDVFRGKFPNSNPNHKWLTWPDPSHKNWPDPTLVKKFWPLPITSEKWL